MLISPGSGHAAHRKLGRAAVPEKSQRVTAIFEGGAVSPVLVLPTTRRKGRPSLEDRQADDPSDGSYIAARAHGARVTSRADPPPYEVPDYWTICKALSVSARITGDSG